MSKIKIVVIEVPRQDDSVFQEVMSFLTEKADYQVLELPPSFYSDKQENYKLLFPGLEIRLKEQTVWRDGIEVSMSHYEFLRLFS